MTPEQKGSLPLRVEKLFYELQDRIFTDIIRRIQKTGEITSTADYQINKLIVLGNSTGFIEQEIKRLTGKTDPEIWELYDKVSNWEYVRYEDAYEQINGTFIPLEENEDVQQWAQAVIAQTNDEIENITRSLGMTVDMGNGKRAFTPLAQYYQKYLDRACLDIVTGSFDYNTVLRRVVKELTASGLKTIDYASGYTCRATVASRRAIMTGVSQLSAQINEMVAKNLGTDTYEVTWHAGHRPSHWWGGNVYTKQELQDVCHLGDVDGLCGANCRHSYLAFIPGYSVRTYSPERLRELEAKEQQTKVYNGKAYTPYQASQAQRQMETKMRAQREKVQLLKEGGADPDDVMLAKAKYQGMLDQYSVFSKKMGIPQQRERIYYDLRGRVATNTKRQNAKYTPEMIRNATRDSNQYDRYKRIIGDSAGSLADFRQMKYNDPEGFDILKKKVDAYSDINKKAWSDDFKQKSKDAYDRFADNEIYMSVHALSRLPRLNKPGLPEVSEEELIKFISGAPKYTEGENKLIYFDSERQLVAVKNKNTGDIVSVVRRKRPKEVWQDV